MEIVIDNKAEVFVKGLIIEKDKDPIVLIELMHIAIDKKIRELWDKKEFNKMKVMYCVSILKE